MRATIIYQITKSKQLTDRLSNFTIQKVKLFKDNGITKLYIYFNNNAELIITSPQYLDFFKLLKEIELMILFKVLKE